MIPHACFRWLCCLWLASPLAVLAQQSLDLTTLEAFRSPGANWQIAGAVSAQPDAHHQIDIQAGTGILVNRPSGGANSNLFTALEHGDIDLHLEFMLPAGSNSGIYLMGRYELQLLDSWGKRQVGFGDCGGIYQRWDDAQPEGAQGYEGYPPRQNACRAPGLWQDLEISFQAPRFDAQGRKIANARFLSVRLNGVLIHEQVELTGPTRGPAFPEEAARGPLMIQGDHGPVAFRQIRYNLYRQDQASLSPLSYQVYACPTLNLPPIESLKLLRQGETPQLTQEVAGESEDFALVFTGELTVPETGVYDFTLDSRGYGELYLDGEAVIQSNWNGQGQATLTAGAHRLRLVYFKEAPWYPNGLGLYIAGPYLRQQALHALGSLPLGNPADPIYVEAGARPRMLRTFVDYADSLGQEGRRITHAINVGLPEGLAYTYDLDRATWVWAWKGPFIDATPMWLSRGDASARPRGLVQPLGDDAGLAPAPGSGQPWPDSLAWTFEGYELDASGLPVYLYRKGASSLRDHISSPDGQRLRREVHLTGPAGAVPSLRLATARTVEAAGRGRYRLDGQYYLEVDPKLRVQQHAENGRIHLLAPLDSQQGLTYTLVW